MPDEQVVDDKPPYISYTTLHNFLDRLGSGPIPPRIDKSSLDTYSGGTQGILLATLRSMEFIDGDGNVLAPLREAATDSDARKAHLGVWASRTYDKQIALAAENGTAQMLHESFADTGYQGSTLRKAVVFYLQMVEYLGLPNSPHFKAPRQPQPSRRRRPPAPPTATPAEPVAVAPARSTAEGQTTVIHVGDMATITVTVDAQWLRLPVDTLTGIRKAVSDLEALASDPEDHE